MAGRKDKNIVDYFPHYCVSGKTLFIIENKYGNDGYAAWFKILELLGSSENHFIDCRDVSDLEFFQAKMKIESNKLNEILNCLSNLNAIHKELWENKIIWSLNFVKNISDAYLRRKTECMNFNDLCLHLTIKCKHKYTSEGIIDGINTQRKVKETKRNYIKEEFLEIFNRWLQYKKDKKQTYKNEDSIKVAYEKLYRFADGNSKTAKKIVEQSLGNNWAGLFQLKEDPKKPGNSADENYKFE